jgi:dienelactone hydrolase
MKQIIQTFIIALLLLFIKKVSAQAGVSGNWSGALSIQGTPLKIILHIEKNPDNTYKGTFDSPDQGAFGIAFTTVTFNSPTINCELPKMQLKVTGDLEANDSLELSWIQGPANFPLTMGRMHGGQAKPARPQEPQGALPYEVREVSFKNKKQNITLYGTLTIPKGKGPFPAVVLISGSGPQDRNSEIFGHKPFFVLSDHLTKNGIAVLRYDDRGTGKSEGEFKKCTSPDLAEDAEYAFEFLKDQKSIDGKRVGLVGHSEGGMLAPMISVRNKDVAFEVLIAGPVIPIDSLMYEQARLTLNLSGAPEDAIKRQLDFNKALFNYLKSKPDYDLAYSGLDSFVRVTLISQIGKDTIGFAGTLKEHN